MPWQKQFDVDKTLAKATDLFWAQGYEATSMDDLVNAMGIHRGSMYATYGDKRKLFIQALIHYRTARVGPWFASLKAHPSVRESIAMMFSKAAADATDEHGRRGCLIIKTALELAPHDPEVGQIVSDSLAELERFYRDQIKKGQKTGEIRADLDAVGAARGLLALMAGVHVMACGRPEKSVLKSIAEQAVAMLD